MAQREWVRNIGAQKKLTKPEMETGRTLKSDKIEMFVANNGRRNNKQD